MKNVVALRVLPAVPATVLLRDPILVFAPNVHGGEDQRHQYGEAAHKGKDHNTLLLRLQQRKRKTLISKVCFQNKAKVPQLWLPLAAAMAVI